MRTVCYSKSDHYGVESSEQAIQSFLGLLILKRLAENGIKPEGFSLQIFRLTMDEKRIRKLNDKKIRKHLFMIRKAPGEAILFADPRGLIFLLGKGIHKTELVLLDETEGYRELAIYMKQENTNAAGK